MTTCWVQRCPEPSWARGLCQWHYQRQQKFGDFACLRGPRPPLPNCHECGVILRSAGARICVACRRARRTFDPNWVNPLVCVCPEPDANPRKDYGMCQVCKRKPLALMKRGAA